MRGVALLAAVLAVALPGAAFAVWGGQQDTAHPGVGAIYSDFSGNGTIEADELICSGSYAGRSKSGANDVFLTAGHCLPPADAGIPANAVFVSFDGDGRNGVSGLIALSSYHQMPGFGHDSATCTTSASFCCRPARCRPGPPRCSCRKRATSTS